MAKKDDKAKIVLEREYIVPLRKEFQKAPKYKRAKKAVKALREFIMKHMKSEDIRIGKYLNNIIWERGIKNPPHKVKAKMVKYDDGMVMAELVGAPTEEKSRFAKHKDKAAKKKAGEKAKEAKAKEEKPVKAPEKKAEKAEASEEKKAEVGVAEE